MKKKIRPDGKQLLMPIEAISRLPKNKTYKLLDVGAAKERYLESFLPENVKYFGLDLDGDQDYSCDLNQLPIPIKDNEFDIILCLETLEHTVYPHKVMKELLRIAKPDALFFLSMPNEYNFYCRINFLLARKTSVQLPPFAVVERFGHVQTPRVKDILNFFSKYINIREAEYRWHSRSSVHGTPIKKAISSLVDKIIDFLASINPSLFARVVVVRN
jgi:SAM-dependent methyltransferase